MKTLAHHGRCRRCRWSYRRFLHPGDISNNRIWQFCSHYSSFCKLVSRNCFAAFAPLTKERRKNRDRNEAEVLAKQIREREDALCK
jgi:hypothetical protein